MRPNEETATAPKLARRYRSARWLGRFRRAAAVLLVLAVVAAAVAGPSPEAAWGALRGHIESWQSWVGRHPLPALAGFFLAVTVATALPLPVLTVTGLVAGALFGTVPGALATSLGYTAGVTVSFLVARWLLRDRVRRAGGRWLRRVEDGVARDGGYYLLTLRLVPSLPFFLVNVLMAATPIPTRTYALVSWLGSLPFAFLCAAVGTQFAALASPADVFSPRVVAALLALALFPLVLRAAVRRFRPRAPTPELP
jgi:uncharacterized membrane protein YdjX (TVP38/TMEM64 family)